MSIESVVHYCCGVLVCWPVVQWAVKPCASYRPAAEGTYLLVKQQAHCWSAILERKKYLWTTGLRQESKWYSTTWIIEWWNAAQHDDHTQHNIGLLNTFPYVPRTVFVFDCIYGISQNRPQNTLCLGRIRISYVNGVFYIYWRGIRYISALNPVYFGVTPYIGVKPYIFWRETLHRVKLSTLTLASKPEQLWHIWLMLNCSIYLLTWCNLWLWHACIYAFAYSVFPFFYTVFADFTRTHRRGVCCDIYMYFVHTVCI